MTFAVFGQISRARARRAGIAACKGWGGQEPKPRGNSEDGKFHSGVPGNTSAHSLACQHY